MDHLATITEFREANSEKKATRRAAAAAD